MTFRTPPPVSIKAFLQCCIKSITISKVRTNVDGILLYQSIALSHVRYDVIMIHKLPRVTHLKPLEEIRKV